MRDNNKFVIALLLMGARPEPYLSAVLESIEQAVDFLVVNDNSQQEASCNRQVLEACALSRAGKVGVVESSFQGFSDARNRCLRYLRAHPVVPPGSDPWILTLDADEVHGDRLSVLTRKVLPSLSPSVGVMDGYFVQFMQCYDFFISLDRRHNMLFRLHDEVAWYTEVHERIRGLRGRHICLPYVYYHYGYVMPNEQILSKWRLYHDLGDPSFRPEEIRAIQTAQMFAHEVPKCMPYRRGHPKALRPMLERCSLSSCEEASSAAEDFSAQAAAWLRQPSHRLVAFLRLFNYRLRVLWRAVQAPFLGVSPRIWPGLVVMALKNSP